jgi:hypothetical protein
MLYIGEALIPCVWMLSFVHVKNVHNHFVDNVYLAISLEMKRCGLGELWCPTLTRGWTKMY